MEMECDYEEDENDDEDFGNANHASKLDRIRLPEISDAEFQLSTTFFTPLNFIFLDSFVICVGLLNDILHLHFDGNNFMLVTMLMLSTFQKSFVKSRPSPSKVSSTYFTL